MRTDYLQKTASVVLDGSGNGSCYVAPDVGQYWALTLVRVSTNQSPATPPYCAVYQGAVTIKGNVTFIDDTQQGNSDASSMVSGTVTQFGEAISAQWTGGVPGDVATVTVYGTSSDTPPALGISIPVVPGAHFSGHATFQMTALANIVAAALANSGVPPIDHPMAVGIVFNQSIAAGATYTTSHLDFGRYQSLVGTIFAQEQLGGGLGTNPYIRMTMNWSLASDNYDPVGDIEEWVGAISPLSFTNNYRHDWASPAFGDTLTMSVTNLDSKAIFFTYGFFGSYRTRTRSVLRSRYPDDYSNEANGTGADDILVSANFGPLAAGATSAIQLMQLWEGPATISAVCSNSPGAGTIAFDVAPQPTSLLGTSFTFLNDQVNTLTPTTIILPRRVCTVKVTNNHPTKGINPTVQIVGQVQPS